MKPRCSMTGTPVPRSGAISVIKASSPDLQHSHRGAGLGAENSHFMVPASGGQNPAVLPQRNVCHTRLMQLGLLDDLDLRSGQINPQLAQLCICRSAESLCRVAMCSPGPNALSQQGTRHAEALVPGVPGIAARAITGSACALRVARGRLGCAAAHRASVPSS